MENLVSLMILFLVVVLVRVKVLAGSVCCMGILFWKYINGIWLKGFKLAL